GVRLVVLQLDSAILHCQEAAWNFGPAPAVVIVDIPVAGRDRMVRVAAAYSCTSLPASVLPSTLLDLLDAAEKPLAPPLRQVGDIVRPIQPLEKEVDAVAQPGQNWMAVDKVVEPVAVQDQNSLAAALQDLFFFDGHPEQVRDDLGGLVMVA